MLGILAAEYTVGGASRSPTVALNRIVDGRRNPIITFKVRNKKEARTIAQSYGAKPWNF